MKTETGKIVIGIDKKVYFEPEGLEKPDWDIFSACFIKHGCDVEDIKDVYNEKMKRYEASKQLIEVSNVYWDTELFEWWYDPETPDDKVEWTVINNQKCKAEVTDTAKIIELTK